MADGDLVSPMASQCILPTVTVMDVTDTMTPGVHGAMADITEADTGVDITMVTIMVTMTVEAELTTQHPMHMEKWIAAAPTDTPGHLETHMVPQEVTLEYMIPKTI